MNKSGTSIIFVGVGIALLVILVWGLIGSSKASEIGNTCDAGIGEDGSVFCWKWHQNVIGDFEEGINKIFNN
jgi:hypothetical protein